MLARLSAVQSDGCDVVVSRFQNSFAVLGLKGQLSYWLSAENCLQLLPALPFCPSWPSQDTAVECFRASRRITWKPRLFWKINVNGSCVLFPHPVCFFLRLFNLFLWFCLFLVLLWSIKLPYWIFIHIFFGGLLCLLHTLIPLHTHPPLLLPLHPQYCSLLSFPLSFFKIVVPPLFSLPCVHVPI